MTLTFGLALRGCQIHLIVLSAVTGEAAVVVDTQLVADVARQARVDLYAKRVRSFKNAALDGEKILMLNDDRSGQMSVTSDAKEVASCSVMLTLTLAVPDQPHAAGAVAVETQRLVHTPMRTAAIINLALVLICKKQH